MRLNLTRLGFFVVPATILVACGGDSGGGGGGGSGPSVALAKTGGDAQTAVVATQLIQTLRVVVTEDGNPKEDAVVAWTPTAGSVPSVTSLTAADGIASTTWTLGQVKGLLSLDAAVSGATPAKVTFTATATPDVANGIVKMTGDNQTEETGTILEPMQVKVVDQFDNGRGGTTITWAVTVGDATILPPSNISAGTGLASAVVTLGPTAGPITVTATAAGLLGSPITFNATSTTPPPPPIHVDIAVVNNAFSPKTSTVALNGTVSWVWGAGAAGHNVISDASPSFASMPLNTPVSAPFTRGPLQFNATGTYKFYCNFHGSAGGGGMSGSVTVK